ncbi:MAG: ferredoxin:thioredoxin reductase [Candidatus Lokiarchaeota archaeon]|nr:ferredoxin:thioredoxin reductase [Candidatus Lokiarchaeota archaeon]
MPNRKTLKDTEKFVFMVAEKQDWELHPDKEFLKMLCEGLTENWNRYGYYSCPCRDGSGSKITDNDIICPCDYCEPDQQEYGHCYCGLYLTKEFAATGKIPKYIPERRPEEKIQ